MSGRGFVTLKVPRLMLPGLGDLIFKRLPRFNRSRARVHGTLRLMSTIQEAGFGSQLALMSVRDHFSMGVIMSKGCGICVKSVSRVRRGLLTIRGVLGSSTLGSCINTSVSTSVPRAVDMGPECRWGARSKYYV